MTAPAGRRVRAASAETRVGILGTEASGRLVGPPVFKWESPAVRSTPSGGVRAPGGPPRLQNECAGEELAGGFDSRPPPLQELSGRSV